MNNDSYKGFLIDSALLFLPLIVLHDVIMSSVEKNLIRSEDIIAYISDYSFAFFIPMGFFLAFLTNFLIKMSQLKKRKNKVWNPIEKTDKRKQKKWKVGFSLISICVFVVCSLILCAGTLQRTVITSDHKIKNYNFAGQVNGEFEPESIRFMKIYPKAEYSRFDGFDHMYAVIEIYINENDCFYFTNSDFDSFEQIVQYKNAVEEKDKKVYVTGRVENDPDPELDDLTEEELKHIEDFYSKYESLK